MLDENKGPGPDGIPPAILKYCGGILDPNIKVYINALMSLGIFPQILKLGYVVPIFKSGDHIYKKLQTSGHSVFAGYRFNRVGE
ncbi:hypothetical protein J6590_024396 [Homalodisca vitripennis]|nr:hypothetical protein J6590_024396 [Homalodisca vitripennis]